MELIVDGEKNFQLTGSPEDAMAAVAAASQYLRNRNRAITALKINDKPVDPAQLTDALTGKPLDDISKMEVESEDIGKLVQDSLREFPEALEALPKACHELAEVFQGDQPEQGYEPCHRLAEIWAHLKARENLVLMALELDAEEVELDGVSLAESHEQLNKHLQEAIDAMKANDCVLLGDLLEYELAPRAEKEAGIVALLQEKARERFG